jgi:hypothetical protein
MTIAGGDFSVCVCVVCVCVCNWNTPVKSKKYLCELRCLYKDRVFSSDVYKVVVLEHSLPRPVIWP